MRKLMEILGLVFCKKATELADKKIYFGLTRKEEYSLFMHKLSCDVCRQYEKQTILLDQLLKGKLTKENSSESIIPSSDFKLRILQRIEQK